MQAVGQAADADAFPDQIAEAGLKPWQVKRVYAGDAAGPRGTSDLTHRPVLPGLGPLAGRRRRRAARAVAGSLHAPAADAGVSTAGRQRRGRHRNGATFSAGWAIPPGSPSRRELPQPLARTARPAATHRQKTPPRPGDSRTSRTRRLVGRAVAGPNRPVDPRSGRRQRGPNPLSTGRSVLSQRPVAGGGRDVSGDGRSLSRTFAHPAGAAVAGAILRQRRGGVARAVRRLAAAEAFRAGRGASAGRSSGPGSSSSPSRRCGFRWPPPIAAWARRGRPSGSTRSQSRDDGRDAWWAAPRRIAAGRSQGPAAEADASCVRAKAKPHLDGRLDDPVWRQAKPAALQSAQHDDGDWPATVMLAYDAEFLYIAIRCREPPDAAREGDSPIRRHDIRAPGTSPRRGRATPTSPRTTASKCSSTSTAISPRTIAWRSIIAAGRTIAAGATPRGTRRGLSPRGGRRAGGRPKRRFRWPNLTGRPPQPRDVWAVGIQRVAPGVGFQSWSTPAAVAVLPDGFGYLVFE